MEADSGSESKFRFAGDWGSAASAEHFAMIRVGGKRIRQSLKTKVLTVAKLRLGDLEKRERANLAGQAKLGEVMRVLHLVKLWRERLEADRAIRPRTKTYYQERLAALLKSWASLAASDVRKINARDCQSWAGKYAKEVSSSSFNNTIGLLRRPVAPNVRVGDCARFALRDPCVGQVSTCPDPSRRGPLRARGSAGSVSHRATISACSAPPPLPAPGQRPDRSSLRASLAPAGSSSQQCSPRRRRQGPACQPAWPACWIA